MIEELVKYIVTELVEDKDAIEIDVTNESEKVCVIKVRVAGNDMGKVIGKNGKVASAIRAIVKSASNRLNKRYIIKIDEKENN